MQSVHSTGAGDAPLAYRVAQFCKAIGLGKTKFYELVADGKIKTIVIGGRRLIPAARGATLRPRGLRIMRRSP